MSQPIVIRKIKTSDTQALLSLQKKIVSESEFLLKAESEFNDSFEYYLRRNAEILRSKNQMIFVAETAEGELVGYLMALGKQLQKIEHTIYIVMGLLSSHQGQGIGSGLMQVMIDWAREIGSHRLELGVMEHNSGAIALYRKFGFEVEGVSRDAVFQNGKYINIIMMARLL